MLFLVFLKLNQYHTKTRNVTQRIFSQNFQEWKPLQWFYNILLLFLNINFIH